MPAVTPPAPAIATADAGAVERERLRAIIEHVGLGIALVNLQGFPVETNAALQRMLGYSHAELCARSIIDHSHPDDASLSWDLFHDLVAGERDEYRIEKRYRRRDGSTLWAELHVRLVRDANGRPRHAVGSVQDIGERRQAEQVLRSSEARYRSLVAASGAIVTHSDGEARWRQPNPMWEAYTGQSFAQYRDHGWLAAVHPEDRDRILESTYAAIDRGVTFEAQGRLWHEPSGTWRYTMACSVPIRDAQGAVAEWVGTVTDIHARTVAEEALRASDRRKDEFLAVLAHELRNPLAPIRSSLDLLAQPELPADSARELVAVAQRQVVHLVRLVDDLMEVSRITRGAIELKRHPLWLSEAVRDAVDACRPLVAERGHQLDLSLPAADLPVLGDRTRLTQVMTNLLNNAAKYTPAGGRITVGAVRDGGWAVLRVRDTGAGIPPDMLQRIFDMFTQGAHAEERGHGGLGIGLALARRLVEQHGGTLAVHSEGCGRGSEFTVRLPLAGTLPDGAAGSAAPARIACRRVLVADDNRDAARMIGLLLQQLGQDVHLTHDGAEAMARAAVLQPDIVLLDLGMPLLSGFEVAQKMRAEPWGREALLVAVTGWGQDEDRRRTAEAGFDRHLVKPVHLDALRELLGPAAPRAG